MYRTYDDRWWYGGLFRKDLISQHGSKHDKKGCEKTQKNRVYLSDVIDLGEKIIVAKPVDIVRTTTQKGRDSVDSKKSDIKTIYNYTYFKDYVEFYHYIKHTNVKQRMFHEVTPEYSSQKARFDIDIERQKYEAFVTTVGKATPESSTSFAKFGDHVKDLVIRNVIEVLKDYCLPLNLERDVCVFTSHRSSKRSYHIVINRYFHYGSIQAQEFHRLCLEKCKSHIDVKLFKTFIDAGIYDKNHPLRTCHSVKKENGVCYEKKFVEEFTFEGKMYTHQLTDEAFSEEEEEAMSDKIRKLHILHRSLITYTNESVPLPSFPITRIEREAVISMSEEIYKECCALVANWDKKGIFTVEGEENGQIHLSRNAPSLCEICRPNRKDTGESAVHDNMNAFCYIHRGYLYWHCYRAKGYSGICLGKLKSYRNQADCLMDDYLKDIMQDEGKECIILEEDGTEYRPPEDKNSYENEVLEIKVDSKNSESCSESNSVESRDGGESFSDDSLDDESEDVSFTKITVIASNKSKLGVLPPANKVMVDGTDSFLIKISRIVSAEKTLPIICTKVNSPILEEKVFTTCKEKTVSFITKGKAKESTLNVTVEDGKQTLNFAQTLRQQSKCRVKYTTKNTATKFTTKILMETTTFNSSSSSDISNSVRSSSIKNKKTLGASLSSLNRSQELTKNKESIPVKFSSNKRDFTLNSLSHKHINR